MSNSARESTALEAASFDVRFEAIISKMDNHRMQMNGMNRDLLRLLQKAASDFGGARLDTAVTENNALKEQVNGLKRRVEELEDENKKLGSDFARLSKDYSRLEKDYANVQDDLHDSDKKNRNLEEKLSESDQTLSQFMALSSRVANTNIISHKRAAEDDQSGYSKKLRQNYEGPFKDFHEDDRSRERSRYDAHLDSTSRREFREYSPSERPLHEPLDQLRNRDEFYSSSGNAQGKVSDYLARLPTPSNTRDDVSSLDRNRTPISAGDINIRGKGSIRNGEKVHIATGPQHSTPAHDSRRPEGVIEVREGSKVWRRNDGSTNLAQCGNESHDSAAVTGGASSTRKGGNGNSLNDNRNGIERNDSKGAGGGGGHDRHHWQNGGPSNQTQSLLPQQHQHINQRRRIVCHACWEVRSRCDNRHICGNCAAVGLECVRTICSDYEKHGVCPRGTGCFKVHDEQGYQAVNFSPFDYQENKRRYERSLLSANAGGTAA